MGLLIVKEDFTGKFKIATGLFDKLDAYITRYEETILIDLLGATLFDLFKADVNTTTKEPQTPIYQNLYNEFHQDYNGCIKKSRGLKDMLLAMIYFEFKRDEKYKSTTGGTTVATIETGREAGFSEEPIFVKYNEGITTYCAIQWYLNKNFSLYPDFNGQYKGLAHWAL
jgi:hypothetical protein